MNPRAVLAAAALLLAGWALPAASAEDAGQVVGFQVGARVSAAFPMGSVSSDPGIDSPLIDEFVAVSIPLQVDVGVTLHRRWFVGGYVQYAWNVLQIGECQKGQTCSVTGLRLGLQATYAIHDDGGPWVGLGTGWEWMFTSYSGPDYSIQLTSPAGSSRTSRPAGTSRSPRAGWWAPGSPARWASSAGPACAAPGAPPSRTSPTGRSTAGSSWE